MSGQAAVRRPAGVVSRAGNGLELRGLLRRSLPDPTGIIGIAILVAMWYALTYVLPASSLPSPQSALGRLAGDFLSAPELSFYGLPNVSLLGSMVYTAENTLIAVGFGTLVGTVAGLISARHELFRGIVDPIVLTAGTVPILIAAPFFLIWFGTGRISSVLLVWLYVLVILYIFAQRAASNVDPVYEDSARSLGADARRLIRDILLPATIPEVLGGIRIALAGAWGLEAIAELLGAQQGIGKIIEVLGGATDVQGIFAALILLGIVAVAFDGIASITFGRLASWSVAARTEGGDRN
jgi:ABC-type nitrate/sulfonate/bicarbonate transport system permease component